MSEPPNKGKHPKHERQDHGWFAPKPHSYTDLIKHPLVEPWIIRFHEGESQESYARALERILEATGKDVEGILALPPEEAKKVVFSVADALKKEGSHAMGKKIVIAAKGFFEANKKPFELDKQEKRKYYPTMPKKVGYEVIPKKEQVYKMADASLSLKAGLRNRAVILCLFQSGVRENCLCRWTYGMFKDKLYPEVVVPVKLVIRAEMDTKLQLYGVGYYITFLQREAAEALKTYLNHRIQRGWQPKDEDLVFVTESTASRDRPLKPANIWEVIKQPQVAAAAGIDSHAMWVRLLRKSFQKVLNQSDIDEDTKEAIMGHKIPGSRGNYFDSHDHDEIASKYMRCQFDRGGPGASEEAAKRAVMAVMKAQYGDKITAEKLKEIERVLPRTATADDMAKLMVTIILGKEETGKRSPKTKKTATNGGTALFETRITDDEQELMQLLDEGWDVIKELTDGRIIVRRLNDLDE